MLDKLAPFQDPNDIPTTVVYENKSGLTPADLATIDDQADQIQELKGVKPTVDPASRAIGADPVQGRAGRPDIGHLQLRQERLEQDARRRRGDPQDRQDRRRHRPPRGAGGQAADSAEAFAGLDGKLLGFTALVVILILLFTYRSPVLWMLPVFSACVALPSPRASIYLLAKYADLTVNGQSQGILTVLVFGAGTDYALLLVARYREELRRHEDRHEAMAFALHRAARRSSPAPLHRRRSACCA